MEQGEKMAEAKPDIPDDIQAMSFEAALGELETIVKKLEEGQVPLEESIDIYSRGTALKQFCEQKLAAAQARVDKVVVSGGALTTEDADLD